MSNRAFQQDTQKLLEENREFLQPHYDEWVGASRAKLKDAINTVHKLSGEDDPNRCYVYPKNAPHSELLFILLHRLVQEENWRRSA